MPLPAVAPQLPAANAPTVGGAMGMSPPQAAPAPQQMTVAQGMQTQHVDNTKTSEAQVKSGLAGYIKSCFDAAKQHRTTEDIDGRMIRALRSIRGEYEPDVLAAIKQYGGSEVYARLTASKVRGVAAMLREIYSAEQRPWSLSPTPDPDLAGPSLQQAIREVMMAEIREVIASGQEVTDDIITSRLNMLRKQLLEMRKKVAAEGLTVRENAIDDLLWEGGFYTALNEFLQDIATFPFAVLKGPIVENRPRVTWSDRKPTVKKMPTMRWVRCSPFDVYFAPWSQNPQDGYIIHRMRTTRASLQALRGLPSYDDAAIQRVLNNGKGYKLEWLSYCESERAQLEQRQSDTNPAYSTGHEVDRPMPMLEFHGAVSGKLLRSWGMSNKDVPDESQDLDVVAYLIEDEVIGVRLNPHPAGFKPFYVDSFERVPGSVYGHGVPDLIEDIQGVGNAALRALVNNMAISSGPLVWLDEDRMSPNDPDPSKLWPWKVFRGQRADVANTSQKPVEFFQPDSNAQELLGVYNSMAQMADDLSSLPRSLQGSTQGLSGAGRTSSGLSMMLEAGSRTIKQAVASIDQNIIEPVIEHLNIYLALLRPDIVVEGDIGVVARGAVELVQKETLRMRKLEFLQITNNPADLQIVGAEGRYNVLKDIASDLGMPTSDVLPNKPAQPQIPGMDPTQGQPGVPGVAAPGTPAAPQQQGSQPAPQEAPTNPTQGVAAPPQV